MEGARRALHRFVMAAALSAAGFTLLLASAPQQAEGRTCSGVCGEYCIGGWGERQGTSCSGGECCTVMYICCAWQE
jgi:hypothetical protein